MPKFTIAGLLWLTVAVALGFAISQGPAPEGVGPQDWSLWFRYHWQISLITCGAVMVLFALVQQGRRYLAVARVTEEQAQFSITLQAVFCIGLASALAAVLIIHFLINRQFVSEFRRYYISYLYDDLWRSLVLQLVLIASLLQFRVRPAVESPASFGTRVVNVLILMGASVWLGWIVTNGATITMLVHAAINAVEAAEPTWLQRKSAFPSHVAEGYRTFWTSFGATVTAGLAALILLADGTIRGRTARLCLRILFAVAIVGLAGFDGWFFIFEYPRMNPDFASVGAARLWSDALAGLLLYCGASVGLAHCSSVRGSPQLAGPFIPKGGVFVFLGALLISVAGAWPVLNALGLFFPRLLTSPFSVATMGLLETIGDMALSPEVLISVLLTICAFAVAWQYLRGVDTANPIALIDPRYFVHQVGAWLVLFVCAVPALAAFAMCYWLGPFVLGF
ncbi:hypothetical protein [Aeoliella sp. SH292]|uniref:hypothetical protein n=1 Tax=Aeoliella sp. SH292 TaxID=3454464 RepID=UPI003F97220A